MTAVRDGARGARCAATTGVSTSAVVCAALVVTGACAATVGYARDGEARGWTSRAFAGASTRARGDRGREEIIRSIPFVDDGVDMRVPWSERERAAEDVEGEVAWYRAVALGAAFDSASAASAAARRTTTGAMASLGARHRRWRDDDESSSRVDFSLPAYDATTANERELKATGFVVPGAVKASSLGDAEEDLAAAAASETHEIVQGIASASDDITAGAMATINPEQFQLMSSSQPTPTTETDAAPATTFPSVVPLPKPLPTPKPASQSAWVEAIPSTEESSASTSSVEEATETATETATEAPMETATETATEMLTEAPMETVDVATTANATAIAVAGEVIEENEYADESTPNVVVTTQAQTEAEAQAEKEDEITAALSSSYVSYKKKIDTTSDVNMYERAEFKAGAKKSTAQMGWKPADARVLTEENIKANEDVEKETLSVSFLSRFPVHLPKSARETQAWKPFAMSDLQSARSKEDTVERVTEAAIELVREQQQQASNDSFAVGHRSRFSDMFSIYFIGPIGALAFFAVFYGVVALVAKKKNESGSNAQASSSGDGHGENDNDENAFLNFLRATTMRHANDKRGESAKPGGVAAAFMSMLKKDQDADVGERDAWVSASNSNPNTYRSNTPATAPASAATSGMNTPVVVDAISDGMLVNRTLSAIRTRERTPPSSPSRPEDSDDKATTVAKKQALDVGADDKTVSVDNDNDNDSTSRRMVTETRQPPPSHLSSPPRPVKAVPVPTRTQSMMPHARRQLEQPEVPSTGAGRRARGDQPPTIVRSMTTKFY